jgi:ParB/RepB/Spo0J family partition protein
MSTANGTRTSTATRIGLVPLTDVVFHPHNTRTNLGDLRALTDSIRHYGILQPIAVEHWGHQLRIRAGHRRTAAARLAGLTRIPAVIHATPLDDDEWLIASVQENEHRRQLEQTERVRAARQLEKLGYARVGIADIFGVSSRTITKWLSTPPRTTTRDVSPVTRARKRLIDAHPDEYTQYLHEEQDADIDPIVIVRALAGDRIQATPAERRETVRRWTEAGHPLIELGRIQGWNVHRYIDPARQTPR